MGFKPSTNIGLFYAKKIILPDIHGEGATFTRECYHTSRTVLYVYFI